MCKDYSLKATFDLKDAIEKSSKKFHSISQLRAIERLLRSKRLHDKQLSINGYNIDYIDESCNIVQTTARIRIFDTPSIDTVANFLRKALEITDLKTQELEFTFTTSTNVKIILNNHQDLVYIEKTWSAPRGIEEKNC